LDIEQQLHCFALLREESQQGKLCVAVTHDLNLALTYCTRLIILEGGVVAHDIPTAKAEENQDWLALFSSRLSLCSTPDRTPWIWYR
jgi:iron complex transport system ATP-binding protein